MTLRILLIDDDLLLGQIIRSLVASKGGQVTQALNGQSGIELALNNVYDHILVDLMLPQIDGLNVLRKLSTQKHTSNFVNLIAISSRKSEEHKKECLTVGANYFLEKPVRPQALFECLGL